MPLLDPTRSYTFSDIFKMNAEIDVLVAELGYKFDRQMLPLKTYGGELDRLHDTQRRIEEVLPYTNLSSETARREILISPVVTDLVHYTQSQLRIEYPINTDRLLGTFDYYLWSNAQMLIIEAKKEDITNGFTQLAAELIALDQHVSKTGAANSGIWLGAVTTGTLWQFGLMDRRSKTFIQGLQSFRNPEDLETLERILIQALTSPIF